MVFIKKIANFLSTQRNLGKRDSRAQKGSLFYRRVMSLLLCFLVVLLPTPLTPSRSARADFTPLASPGTVANWASFCNDLNSVIQIITLFNQQVTLGGASSAAAPVTGGLIALAEQGQTISRICSLVIAAATAKDINGVLRAAQILNTLTYNSLEDQIDHFEAAMSFYDFATNLRDSHQTSKQKALNVNNWSRVLNYSFATFNLDGIDARRKIVENTLRLDQAQGLEEMTDAVYGCRKAIAPLKSGEALLPDGPTKKATIDNLAKTMDKYGKIRDSAAGHVEKIQKILLKMLAEVSQPKELSNAAALVDTFTRKAFWVSVGYIPPTDKKLEDGTTAVVPSPYQKYAPPNGSQPAGSAAAFPPRPASEIKKDTSNVFYKSKGTILSGFCDISQQPTYQMELWAAANIDVLADRFIRGSTIADAVQACPLLGEAAALYSTPIAAFHPPLKENVIAKPAEVSDAVEENCKLTNVKNLYKDLKDLKSLGNDPGFGGVDSYSQTNCRPTATQEIRNTPITWEENENIQNFDQFVTYYNDKFNAYIDQNYALILSENAVFRGVQYAAGSFSKLAAGERDDIGTRNTWNANNGNQENPEQLRFFNAWRTYSLCSIPSYLARKYPDKKDLITNLGKPENNTAFDTLVLTCRADERKTASNKDIFRDMFVNGLAAELQILAQAKAEIFKADLKLGSFKSGSRRKPATCIEDSRPQDVNKVIAMAAIQNAETSQKLVDAMEAMNEQNRLNKAKAEAYAAEAEQRYLANITEIRAQQAREANMTADPMNNAAYSWGDIGPSMPQLSTRERVFGQESLPEPTDPKK